MKKQVILSETLSAKQAEPLLKSMAAMVSNAYHFAGKNHHWVIMNVLIESLKIHVKGFNQDSFVKMVNDTIEACK